jgi:hypothetical protein
LYYLLTVGEAELILVIYYSPTLKMPLNWSREGLTAEPSYTYLLSIIRVV